MDSFNVLQLLARAANSTEVEVEESQYGYIPNEKICLMFLVLFGVSTALHLGQAIYFRMWWLLPTATLCGIGELVGWVGRYWSSQSPAAEDPYMMQITTTIIAPTPLIAVSFILLGRIVERVGPCYSWLSPKWYSIIFVSCDLVALVVQGVGGGLAASADDQAGSKMGANIMLGGIVFQFVALLVYTSLAFEFLRRYTKNLPLRLRHTTAAVERPMDPHVKILITALTFSTFVLLVRSVYRIIELSAGWHSKIIETEIYFNVFDGAMVVLAIFTINVAHPGLLLGSFRSQQRYSMAMEKLNPESTTTLPLRYAESGLREGSYA
ncbi:RTA1 like protein-domain-containing protein [Mycena rebaudengoi]|nr:RTA1 like protein-domain-containing protein [Mycena rebaudengoi]